MMTDSLPELDDLTLVYLCDSEWCDEGFHIEPPVAFDAFAFRGDVDEFSGDGFYMFPIKEGRLTVAWRMPCKTWFVNKPKKMTVLEAKEKLKQW